MMEEKEEEEEPGHKRPSSAAANAMVPRKKKDEEEDPFSLEVSRGGRNYKLVARKRGKNHNVVCLRDSLNKRNV